MNTIPKTETCETTILEPPEDDEIVQEITFASLFLPILCWPPLFTLGLNLYGYRAKPLNMIAASVWMEVVMAPSLKFSILLKFGPFIQCLSIFMLLWLLRFRCEIVEALIITATLSGILTLVKGIVVYKCDPALSVTEYMDIALTLTVLAQIVACLKIQFTFISSPRVKAKHGRKIKRFSLLFIIVSATLGYTMTYLPSTFAISLGAMAFINLVLLIHHLFLEFN